VSSTAPIIVSRFNTAKVMKLAELLIIVVVVLVVFGSTKLPELARRAAKEFRHGFQGPSDSAGRSASDRGAGG